MFSEFVNAAKAEECGISYAQKCADGEPGGRDEDDGLRCSCRRAVPATLGEAAVVYGAERNSRARGGASLTMAERSLTWATVTT